MVNIIKQSAVFALLLLLFPIPDVLADASEEPTAEESEEQPVSEESTERPVNEEPTEQQDYEAPTEEPAENRSRTAEEFSNEYVPSQNEQPQYEETDEMPYQSYEETTEAPYRSYEETAEMPDQNHEAPTEEFFYEEEPAGKMVEEQTEEVTEAPSEEISVELKTAEAPSDVIINQSAEDTFSITGEVVADSNGLEGVAVTLSGEKTDEVTTDAHGKFSFTEIPAGEYELHAGVPEGYTAEKEKMVLTVEDRGKQGILFVMEEEPSGESVETENQVMSDEETDSSNNMAVILVGIVLLAIVAILFIVRALRK